MSFFIFTDISSASIKSVYFIFPDLSKTILETLSFKSNIERVASLIPKNPESNEIADLEGQEEMEE